MTDMKKYEALTQDLDKAKQEYLKAVPAKPACDCVPLAAEVRRLQDEIQKLLSAGAKPAPDGSTPIGMLKTPTYFDKRKGIQVPPVFEIGSVWTPHRSRGTTPEEAVKNWNEDIWLETDAELIASWNESRKAKETETK